MTSNREKYRQFCKTEKELPIFMQDWWLDAVCGEDGWGVAIYKENNKIRGVFPYPFHKKKIFRVVLTQHLTRMLGPWLKYPENLLEKKRLSYEQQVYEKLIEQLPKFDWFNLDFSYQVNNWKYFYWEGFNQTTKYMSIVGLEVDVEHYFDSLDKVTRKRISKAKTEYKILEISEIENVYKLFKEPYERQNLNFPISKKLIVNLFETSVKKGCGVLFGAENNITGGIDLAAYCVWDNTYLYLLISGGNESSRNNYAKYLVTFQAIKMAFEKNLIFNFAGSMMKSVDSFNRKFAKKQIPYFNLEKINSRLLKFYFALRG